MLRAIAQNTHATPDFAARSRPVQAMACTSPRVAILLCTYQGARFLTEQLDSILGMKHRNWQIFASDDGSSDATGSLLLAYQQQIGKKRLSILRGPERGFASNFLSLVHNGAIEADYFAWCDQDDRWHPDKLSAALRWLARIPSTTPALYCGRTELIAADGTRLGRSPLFVQPPGFGNALVQNIGGGNTMVFNRAARDLLRSASRAMTPVSHDWWAYLLVSGAGGEVLYDQLPRVSYRQHPHNLVGANTSLRARLTRIAMVLSGRFRQWNELNVRNLAGVLHLLTEDNHALLRRFEDARRSGGVRGYLMLRSAGIYRQTWQGNLGILLALLCRRF